ncbi:MAG: hypothetical protein HYY31_04650 [Chloroflexi bacterium]|nr:hypothetical protein [Chloroflexota bacterium]
MRTLLLMLLAAAMMATVGIYAASITGSTKTLGGTGSVAVSAPASTTSVSWTTNSSGQVTGGTVTWTPSANANYTVRLSAGGQTGTASITSSGTTQRNDAVTLGSAVEADAVSSATVVISQD